MPLENLARNIRTSAAALAATACTGGGGGGGGCSPTEPCGGGDTQKPSISWTALNNNATVQGTVPLSVNANDNVGVTNVAFYNGSQQISSDNSAPYTANLNTNNLQNGNYTLKATARDAAGNTNDANIAVTVNNPLARPNANNINLTVQEDSTQNHDLAANVTGEQNGATFSILNKPNDVNATINGSTLRRNRKHQRKPRPTIRRNEPGRTSRHSKHQPNNKPDDRLPLRTTRILQQNTHHRQLEHKNKRKNEELYEWDN